MSRRNWGELRPAADPKVPQREQVHLGPQKTIQRFLGITDDWFVLVERRVQYHRHSGQTAEFSDQRMVTRIGFFVHSLQTPASVDMRNRWNQLAMFRADLEHLHHERHVVVLFKPFRYGFAQN